MPSGRRWVGQTGGALADIHPVELLAQVLRALLRPNGIDPATIERTGGRYRLQTMCEAGGMANAATIGRV